METLRYNENCPGQWSTKYKYCTKKKIARLEDSNL